MQRGEAKRIDMDKNWKDYILRSTKSVRNRCRKGMPISFRSDALANLCVAKILMEKINGRFKELKVKHQQVTSSPDNSNANVFSIPI